MRGNDRQQADMYSYISAEEKVRANHPLRAIRAMADEALKNMSRRFDSMYAKTGRPSIAPEKLLRAQLIQMLYSIRSERLLMEEVDYSVLFRWFVGMNLDEPVWDVTVFTKNRNRLLEGDVAREFLCEVIAQAQAQGLTSDEHFTVDGTLIEAWASLKSFQQKDQKSGPPPDDPGNPTVNFHGESRRNDTHESSTDADALLARIAAPELAAVIHFDRDAGQPFDHVLAHHPGMPRRAAGDSCWKAQTRLGVISISSRKIHPVSHSILL